MSVTDPNSRNSEQSTDTETAAETKSNAEQANVADGLSADKKVEKPSPPKTLMEFLIDSYEAGKISAEGKKALDRLEGSLSDENRVKIVELAIDKDPDFRIALSLAGAVLEGSMHARSHAVLLACIENVVSAIEEVGENSTNTIFQSWLDISRGVSDTVGYFNNRIKKLKDSEKKGLSQKKRQNILCIATIWLYYKQEINFDDLLHFYSKNVFDLEGEAGIHIEPTALAFTTSMASSNKKAGFSYFLSKVLEVETYAKNELRKQSLAIDHLEQRLEAAKGNNAEMAATLDEAETKVSTYSSELTAMKAELVKFREQARHAAIHQKDDKDALRVKVVRLLEEDLGNAVRKAKIANSRIEPNPKTEIVDYQLDEVLEIIKRELTWLKL